jgi:DNA-directed RNA polymerase subunit M/transcription elongation factor TFIIS
MPTLSTVSLTTKGEVKKANLQLSEEGTLTIESIQKYFKKKDEPENICCYECDGKYIFVFGYKKGKKGTENKTQLPEPYNTTVVYGDAIVVVSMNTSWDSPVPYTVEQWTSFVNQEDESEDEEEEDGEEVEGEEEEDVGSVKDAFEESDAEVEPEAILEEDDEEPEPEPVVKKRKTPVYNKVDLSVLKEEVSLESTVESSTLRKLCMKSLQFLKDNFKENDIEELEKAIFTTTYNNAKNHYIPCNWKLPQFCELYRQIVRSVLSNIHPESPVKNPRLLSRVIDGEFTLSSIPSMTSYEMYPENWFDLKDKLVQREQKILEGNKSRATDQFKCRRCFKRECTYYELQTRSADEPMTIFITCLNCGKEWRQGG